MYFLAGGGILSFNTGFAIWVAISMVVFLFLMYKYAVPPIMQALEERETKIRESLESAEKALERAEKVSKDNEKALKEAEVQAQKIRKEALADAELLRTERLEKAKDEADKMLVDARKLIEQEKKRALTELRNEVAELAVKSASLILDTELDEKKNKNLVDKFISEIPKN